MRELAVTPPLLLLLSTRLAATYLGAFLRVAGLLHHRLVATIGKTNRLVVSLLVDPAAFRESHQWVNLVCSARTDAHLLQKSFTAEEYTTASLSAPSGYIITSTGDPSSIAQDLLPTIPVDTIPRLDEAAASPKQEGALHRLSR